MKDATTGPARRRAAWLVLGCALHAGCPAADPAPDRAREIDPKTQAQTPAFSEVAFELGIDFVHESGGYGEKHVVETIGSGGGFLDYDGDGDLDVFLVQSGPTVGHPDPGDARNRLYRNDGGCFVDVTPASGASDEGYGMGCASGDYDGDGDLDLYVTNFGPNVLYRNEGDGTFTDVTAETGVGDPRWGASAAFFDLEGDGDLDLYVVNYLEFDPAKNPWCGRRQEGMRAHCHPGRFPGQQDVLYRNDGDGIFTDASSEAGIVKPVPGRGLGVVGFDCDQDGDTDLYVANDTTANYLFLNHGDGTLEDIGLRAGVAYNAQGKGEAGMGVDAGDFDGDGWIDLFVTNFAYETNTLYRNLGDGTFVDQTVYAGLAEPGLRPLGFGTGFFDFDRDGWLDLYVANGHVMDNIHLYDPTQSFAQSDLLMRGTGRSFVDASTSLGRPHEEARVGRGAAFGDVDNDGDEDVLVQNNDAPPWLLRNEAAPEARWIGWRALSRSGADAYGVRVGVLEADRWRKGEVRPGRSYLSIHDTRLLFGLGASRPDVVERVRVWWPSGAVDVFVGVPAGRYFVSWE